jgi:hypothetical protein
MRAPFREGTRGGRAAESGERLPFQRGRHHAYPGDLREYVLYQLPAIEWEGLGVWGWGRFVSGIPALKRVIGVGDYGAQLFTGETPLVPDLYTGESAVFQHSVDGDAVDFQQFLDFPHREQPVHRPLRFLRGSDIARYITMSLNLST